MIFVADTSPINYLIVLGYIEILPNIYGRVLIPQAVLDELQDKDAPAEVCEWLSTSPPWLEISNRTFQPDPVLVLLDRGEIDAILLAQLMKADRLIIDDLDGRREAAKRKKSCDRNTWHSRGSSAAQPSGPIPGTYSVAANELSRRPQAHTVVACEGRREA